MAKNDAKTPVSRPQMIHTVTLHTPNAQRVFSRKFDEVSRNLYSLSVVARIVAKNEDAVDDLNQLIEDRLVELQKSLDGEIERLNHMREENGIEAIPSYTEPLEAKCDVSSPLAMKFVHAIQKLDRIVMLIDSLWIHEELDAKQKKRGEYRWQQAVFKFANQLREISNRARKAAKSQEESPDGSGEDSGEDSSGDNAGDPEETTPQASAEPTPDTNTEAAAAAATG